MAEEITIEQGEVVAQEGALVGDENQPEPREASVDVNQGAVPAQVSPPRAAESETVPVLEVAVKLDEPVLDPSSPEAVQVPDAGRGSLDLPIHALAQPTPEEALASGDAPEVETPPVVTEPNPAAETPEPSPEPAPEPAPETPAEPEAPAQPSNE
jgi:hypothetical protein